MAAPTLGSPRSNPRKINYLRIGIALLFIAVGLYIQWRSSQAPPQTEQAKVPTATAKPEDSQAEASKPSETPADLPGDDSSGGTPLELPVRKSAPATTGSKTTGTKPAPVTRPPVPKDTTKPIAKSGNSSEKSGEKKTSNMKIPNLTIRDQDGKVVFEGTVDISETVARIEAGEKLSRFGHDGITFENRERRLPQKPKGYYHEYVHPTKGVSGPGPQRVVMGEEGEIWFTHDHYRTFKRINP